MAENLDGSHAAYINMVEWTVEDSAIKLQASDLLPMRQSIFFLLGMYKSFIEYQTRL